MINSPHSSVTFLCHANSNPKNTLELFRKHWLISCATKIFICMLCYQAAFNHKTDSDVEIEEEETELVIIVHYGKKEKERLKKSIEN